MLVVGDNAPAEEGVVSLSALHVLSVLSRRRFTSPLSELMHSDDFLQNTIASKKLWPVLSMLRSRSARRFALGA